LVPDGKTHLLIFWIPKQLFIYFSQCIKNHSLGIETMSSSRAVLPANCSNKIEEMSDGTVKSGWGKWKWQEDEGKPSADCLFLSTFIRYPPVDYRPPFQLFTSIFPRISPPRNSKSSGITTTSTLATGFWVVMGGSTESPCFWWWWQQKREVRCDNDVPPSLFAGKRVAGFIMSTRNSRGAISDKRLENRGKTGKDSVHPNFRWSSRIICQNIRHFFTSVKSTKVQKALVKVVKK